MAKMCKLHKGLTRDKHGPANTTGHEMGVHVGTEFRETDKIGAGQSDAGMNLRDSKNPAFKGKIASDSKANALSAHRKVLSDLKNMPKPNLGKAEHSATCKKSLSKSEEGKHDPKTSEDSFDPCPYCADSEDNRTDDCAYCQDLDAVENADGTAGMDNCPACQEYDANNQESGGVEGCPYCDEETVGQATAGEAATDIGAESPDDCPECQELYGQAIEEQPDQTGQGDPNLQGHETAEEVLDLLDQEPGAGPESPAQEAQKIDNTEMPQGQQMKEGTSVTDDFGQAQKNDIPDSDTSMSQDEPDMTGVLQSGLEDHANEQKKQQVLDMVGQTLAGFKANKASLEATKEQNQPLYNSCIQMLKSMIALCDLLGLKPQAQPAPAQEAPGTPSPAMPPQTGAPAEEPSDPKAVG